MGDSRVSILTKKRELLTQKEGELLDEIENKTAELNGALNKTLKTSLFVGGGLVAGYTIYRLLSNDEEKPKKNKSVAKKNNLKRRIFRPILTLVAEKGLSILMDSLKNKTEK